MTPAQTKRRIAVMQKHGEPGWRIEVRWNGQWQPVQDTLWRYDQVFRAVRVEATQGESVPLPWSTIKCGMVVRWIAEPDSHCLITRVTNEPSVARAIAGDTTFRPHNRIHCEYLDGSTWKPLWTEEPVGERIVEVISEEGV